MVGFMMWNSLLVAVAAFALLVASVTLAALRKFGQAKRIAFYTLSGVVIWVVTTHAVALLTPRTIVRVGETYCYWDNICMGVDEVITDHATPETIYTLNMHIHNDAKTVKDGLQNIALYLKDERGRRFPMIPDSSVTPYDSLLDPGQSIKTSLTFKVSPDVRQLFLAWEGQELASTGGKKPPSFWQPIVGGIIGLIMYGGGGYLFHKDAVLRVL